MIALQVNNKKYVDWDSGKVFSSIMTLADSFTVKGLNRFAEYEIKSGDECEVFIDDALIITGYIDELVIDFENNITISGRSKTADFIDCEAVSTTVFNNRTMQNIISTLGTEYAITVSGVDSSSIDSFVVGKDEKVADAILRLATIYDITATSDSEGNVLLIDGSTFERSGLSFKQGENITEARIIASDYLRFSSVQAIGQSIGFEDASATVAGTSDRTRVTRRLIDGNADLQTVKTAAQKGAEFSNGSAVMVELSPTGLFYDVSAKLVTLDSDTLGIVGDMLIEESVLEWDFSSAKNKWSNINYVLVSPEKYGGTTTECEWMK